MGLLFQQLKALIRRNLLLKKRNKKQLFQEIGFPIYFVLILAGTKLGIRPQTKPPITGFPVNPLNSTGFQLNKSLPLLVSPNTSNVLAIMPDVANLLGGISYQVYPDSASIEREYKNDTKNFGPGIIFQFQGGSLLSYAIRMDPSDVSDTYFKTSNGDCRSDYQLNGTVGGQTCEVNNYLTSGFIALQNAIDTALIRFNLSKPAVQQPDVFVQLMPKGEFVTDTSYLQAISAIYFVFAYSFFINFLVTNIVAEKEKKIKEGMKMMGLNDIAFWLSWSVVYLVIIFAVTIIVILIVFAIKFFERSNLFIFFMMLFLYGLSIINLAFLMTPFFKKAKTAGFLAGFSTIVFSCLYFAVSSTRTVSIDGYSYSIGSAGRILLCLISPVALALSVDQAVYLDTARGGMTFETATIGEFPLYEPLVMLAVDTVLYGLLAFYLDRVIPGEYGVSYKPWFCFLPSYWCGGKQKNHDLLNLIDNAHISHNKDSIEGSDIEPISAELKDKDSLRLLNITKTFTSKKETVTAVNGISLDIYEGQITGLLGHNGAGKTTLLNMLCGLTPMTSGGAIINNLDVSDVEDMKRIRSMCGICPQHNILLEDLSCREHLQVFASLKGVPENKMEAEISQSLKDVDLEDQADVFSKNLSGGQKRKLSVAIALIGNPKIIFLDEPTAGMDPYSRRHLWSLLKKRKEGKVIVLTTHFMDEADILADRKAIISKGKLRCCGSSLFLKSKFGIGYHLNMVVEPSCDVDSVTNLLKGKVNGIELKRSHAKELAYTIPLNEVEKFSDMFFALEEKNSDGGTKAEKMGILSYGVSMTTLEEVFLKIGDEVEPEENVGGSNPALLNENEVTVNMRPCEDFTSDLFNSKTNLNLNSGKDLTLQRIKALLKIRFLILIRNKMALCFQTIIPVILVLASILLNKYGQSAVIKDPVATPVTNNPYVNMRNAPIRSSNFLFLDSLNNVDSQAVVNQINSSMYVDDIKNSSINLMSVAPHNVGVDLTAVVPQTSIQYTALYNDTALMSLPVITNIMSNALLGTDAITVYNFPWPQVNPSRPYDNTTFSSILILGMAFVLLMAGFAGLLVQQKEWKTKSQQRVSGVTFNVYWGINFLFDVCVYLVPALCCVIVVLAFQLPSLSPAGAVICILILFITIIPANILFAYCFSFAFDKFETCIAVLPNVFVWLGLLPYIVVSVLDMVLRDSDVPAILHYVFCTIDPPYVVFGGFYYIDRVYRVKSYFEPSPSVDVSEYFQTDSHVPYPLFIPILQAVILYYVLNILDVMSNGGKIIEVFRCGKKGMVEAVAVGDNNDVADDEDEDVKEERQKVASIEKSGGNLQGCVAYVSNLRKEFKKRGKTEYKGCTKVEQDDKIKVAVRNATLSVKAGEVFGLLGPNGAGKTTLMNMVIAEVGASQGKVVINGHNIKSNMSEAFQALGYCPQHDALWEGITVKEHLECYAALRGVPTAQIPSVIQFYLDNLKIQEHANKNVKKCSGGTKRKLSYAMSMLGSPEVVLLDEPSTGMDPQSKRFLWDTISSSFSSSDKGAILTTHYMEEADALCNRLAIMVNGNIECLGPSQHLKDKYGSGYSLEVKVKPGVDVEEKMDKLEEKIKTFFPQATCTERFGDRAQYKVPRDNVTSLAESFSALEQMKQTMNVEEYSFSQATLEQVFLEFAKKQLEEGDDAALEKSPKRKTSNVV